MPKIQLSARFAIHPGKFDEFMAVAKDCLKSAKAKDTGALQYDWFVDEGGAECVVRETYRDSDAVLEHITNLGELFGRLLGAADFSLEIYGQPSPQLMEAATPFPHRVYRFAQGL